MRCGLCVVLIKVMEAWPMSIKVKGAWPMCINQGKGGAASACQSQ